jgi:radical SAM protein with 4Fe4S-binding SPASM domain
MSTPAPSEYRDLTTALYQRAAAAGIPLGGAFELTSRCNLACRMCYIRHDAADAAARSGELSARQWLALAEEATAAGLLFLLLTGGEIFLRPDFLEIYLPLTGMGLSLILYSNGTLVTPALARALGTRPPSRMEVTLYGATPETYATVTGHADGFARALRGIDLLCEAGMTVAVKFTITRDNVHEYDAIRDIAHARGLPVKAGWLLTARVDGASGNASHCRLSSEDVGALEGNDAGTRERWATMDPVEAAAACAEPMYCLAGRATFAINPHGAMNPCVDLPVPAALPLEVGFPVAWEAVRSFVRTVPATPECVACDLRAYCPTCPARAYVETGTLTGVDTYACAIARARVANLAERMPANPG